MTVSTDGILFYGFLLENDPEEWEAPFNTDDWEEVYCAKKGLPAPADPYEGRESLFKEYWTAKRDLLKEANAKLSAHCSGDYPMWYVCVNASETTANRGYPQQIDNLNVGPDWHAKLKDFCDTLGIEYQQPRWWLVSYWG